MPRASRNTSKKSHIAITKPVRNELEALWLVVFPNATFKPTDWDVEQALRAIRREVQRIMTRTAIADAVEDLIDRSFGLKPRDRY